MSDTCPHGFTPSECLICRTLGTQPQVQVEAKGRSAGRANPPSGLPASLGPPPARPDAVYPPDAPGRRSRSLGTRVTVTAVGLVAIGAVVWIVAGVVFTLLHVIELALVAALAGWVGYQIGYFRGRRHKGP